MRVGFPLERPRRLRQTPALRRLVRETRLSPSELVLPLFVREGIDEPSPIATMPGVVQHSRASLRIAAREAVEAGIGGLMLYGVPAARDATGTGADDPGGILNVGLRDLREEVGDAIVVMADLCLDEFTDHGHCGVLDDGGRVDNDGTLERYASMALAQADAGAHVLGLSGMMDGQVGHVRAATPSSSPTPRSTRRRSTARSARRSSRRWSATGRRTSKTRATRSRRCARCGWTSARAPTS